MLQLICNTPAPLKYAQTPHEMITIFKVIMPCACCDYGIVLSHWHYALY